MEPVFLSAPSTEIPAWHWDALCAQTDPEAFFPEKGGTTKPAKDTCKSCDVRRECLKDALDNDERFGIWGGLSERDRRKFASETKYRTLSDEQRIAVVAQRVPGPVEPEIGEVAA